MFKSIDDLLFDLPEKTINPHWKVLQQYHGDTHSAKPNPLSKGTYTNSKKEVCQQKPYILDHNGNHIYHRYELLSYNELRQIVLEGRKHRLGVDKLVNAFTGEPLDETVDRCFSFSSNDIPHLMGLGDLVNGGNGHE